MTTFAVKDIRTVASNNFLVTADSNIELTASRDVRIRAEKDFISTIPNGSTKLYTQSNLHLFSHDSNMFLTMDAPSDTVTLYGLSNMTINTSNALTITARTDINQTSSNLFVKTKNDMEFTASNSQIFTACNNINITASNDVNIRGNNVNIVTRSDISYTALSNLNFFVSSATDAPQDPIFQVSGGVVRVRGDLMITGSINTSNIINTTVVQENLKVTDKVLMLANVGDNTSNDTLPLDGLATNDAAGIEIDGLPGGVNSNEFDMHKKFFKWRYNTAGTMDLGTSNLETESFWDLQGGSLRMTKKRNYGTVSAPVVKEVAFGFRINENDELELFKKFWRTSSSNYVFKRLTKFGRIL